MKKRIFQLLAFLALLLALGTLMAVSASAKEAAPALDYKLVNNRYYKVVGIGDFDGTELTIPATYNGKPVQAIGRYAFRNQTQLTKVVLPDSIQTVGHAAFYGCKNLTDVTLSAELSKINSYTFAFCSRLQTLVIPERVTEIGASAFRCSGLQRISLPEGLTTIGDNVFRTCTNLREIIIPDNVTNFGKNIFFRCITLNRAEIGNGVSSIPTATFRECRALTTLRLGTGIRSIGDYAFENCNQLSYLDLPEGITSIGYQAISQLPLLILPRSLKEFSANSLTALYSGSKIQILYKGTPNEWQRMSLRGTNHQLAQIAERIYFYSASTPIDGNRYWHYQNGIDGQPEFYLRNAMDLEFTLSQDGTYYIVTGRGTSNLFYFSIPPFYKGLPVKEIADGAFKSSTKTIQSVTIPDGITRIGAHAFENTTIFHVDLPASLEYLGDYAFANTNLESVQIPASLRYVGEGAFSDTGLTTVYIPETVEYLGPSVFAYCSRLSNVQFSENSPLTAIPDYAFYRSSRYKTVLRVTFPKGITHIGSYAFSETVLSNRFVIPDTIESIGEHAFSGMSGMTEITLPKTLRLLGRSSFRESSLKYVTFADDCSVNVGAYAFAECHNLRAVDFSDSIRLIGGYAFYDCNRLHTIRRPINLEKIGNYAFANCYSLKLTKLPSKVTSIGEGAFAGCDNIQTLCIPKSIKSIGDGALPTNSKLTAVFYCGTEKNWRSVTMSEKMRTLLNDHFVYYYAHKQPKEGFHWHYVDGVPTNWGVENEALRLQYELKNGTYTVSGIGTFSQTDLFIPSTYKGIPVTAIGDRAFYGCGELVSVTIPCSVTTIGNYAFYDCNSLTSITISDGVTSIGARAFAYCSVLKDISFGNSLTTIGNDAFRNCDALVSITIPRSMTRIARGAFYNCTSLTTVYYDGTDADWDRISIESSNTNLTAATRYYYSATTPTTSGNYWHYVDGVPTKW